MKFATERAHKALPPAERNVKQPLRPDAAAGSEQHQAALQFAAGAGASFEEAMQVGHIDDDDIIQGGTWSLPVDAHVDWLQLYSGLLLAREARIPIQTVNQYFALIFRVEAPSVAAVRVPDEHSRGLSV